MAQSSSCAHEGCRCNVPEDRAARSNRYCSDYCEKHSAEPAHQAHQCACGHSGCQ
jgi:hypothetical protein